MNYFKIAISFMKLNYRLLQYSSVLCQFNLSICSAQTRSNIRYVNPLIGADGLSGNDDCGQMSAWYIFSAMGFYPVDPVSREYVFGAPQLQKLR